MRWKVVYTKSARRDLSTLDVKIAQKIVLKIRYFAGQKNPLRFSQRLHHPFDDLYRFRVGDYRAIFKITSEKEIFLLFILRVKHRKDIYE